MRSTLRRRGSELQAETTNWAPSEQELFEAISHYWLTEMKPSGEFDGIEDEEAICLLVEGYLHGG